MWVIKKTNAFFNYPHHTSGAMQGAFKPAVRGFVAPTTFSGNNPASSLTSSPANCNKCALERFSKQNLKVILPVSTPMSPKGLPYFSCFMISITVKRDESSGEFKNMYTNIVICKISFTPIAYTSSLPHYNE